MRLIGFYDCSRNDLQQTHARTQSAFAMGNCQAGQVYIQSASQFVASLAWPKKFKPILIRRSGKLLPMCKFLIAGRWVGVKLYNRIAHTKLLQLRSHLAPLVDSISLLGSSGNIFGNELLTIAIQFHTQFGQKCRRACCTRCRCHRK